MNKYIIPPQNKPIKELYVVMYKDKNGDGIVSVMSEYGQFPLVTGDESLVANMTDMAKKMSEETGKKIIVAKFTGRENLEVFNEH